MNHIYIYIYIFFLGGGGGGICPLFVKLLSDFLSMQPHEITKKTNCVQLTHPYLPYSLVQMVESSLSMKR